MARYGECPFCKANSWGQINFKIYFIMLKKMDPNKEIRFTGIVVTYNDEKHLRECLNSLSFCDQLIVIDLGSTDNSLKISRVCGAKIIHHRWVPIVEEVRAEAIHYSKNNWIIFLDPDEIFPSKVINNLRLMISQESNLATISIPWQFYFKGNSLDSTIWGMKRTKDVVFHKKRNLFKPYVHNGVELVKGYTRYALPWQTNNVIKHYWMDSYRQLLKKHWRYIRKEGEARYKRGERFTIKYCITEILATFKYNMIDYKGIYDGFTGYFLSLFYTWYYFMSCLSLFLYENTNRNRIDQDIDSDSE